MLALKDLRIDYLKNPLGIDVRKPKFSWKLISDQNDVMQKSYRITVSKGEAIVWDTGVMKSDTSLYVRYAGEELSPKTRYEVKVFIESNKGEKAEASCFFETGLLSYDNMNAQWITHGFEDKLEAPAVFKKTFSLKTNVKKARVYASALGIYEFRVNKMDGSDVHFAPGWTSYQENLQYQTYDITNLLKNENEIEFTVANGWYKGILGFFNQGNHYGNRTALIAQIEITYEDGEVETVCTDESWISTTGEIRYSELYHGETIDKSMDSFKEKPAVILDYTKEVLKGQVDEPVRITERISGQKLIITPNKEVVIDFGQNVTGVVEFKTKQQKGTKIVVRHAEVLDKNGNFYTVNLRTAKCTDTFICSGEEDIFRPKFTYHGFRYIAVEGLGENINPSDFTACVIHTDLEKTAGFKCSDERVNRLMQNVDWGLRDNFLDIPTDCPQRDERLGYTGDGQIFLPTAATIRFVPKFFEKWLADLRYEQKRGNGGVPTTVPNILGEGGGIAIWHDAATIFPWTLYENYGDEEFLEQQFDSMKDCVDYYTNNMCDEMGLVKKGQQLGDWVSMDVPRGPMTTYLPEVWNLELVEKIGATDPYFIANIYYFKSAELTAKAAKILGKTEDAVKYEKLSGELKQKIRDEYITKTGRVLSSTQTANALAIAFGIASDDEVPKMSKELVDKINLHKGHLTTGFAGTPYLCPVLSKTGHHDVAGSVFLKDDCPSWLYHVKMGATTMWELWDGVNPDGSFNRYEMNSFNHYSYGSIGSWVYHNLLGINYAKPGYKESVIAPRFIKGIPEMGGYIDTVYGVISVKGSALDGKYCFDIEIPANTTAKVLLPEQEEKQLGSGKYHFEYATECSFVKERYDMESKFGELLDNPTGMGLLHQYAKELMDNELFLMFAKEHTITEVMTMLPEEVKPLMDMVIVQCNANPED